MNSQRSCYHRLARFMLAFVFLLAACGPAAPTPTPLPPTPTMSPDLSLVMTYQNTFNRHDVEGVMALLTEDVSVLIPGILVDVTTWQDVQKYHEFFSGANVEIHITDCQASADTVTCKQTFTEDCIDPPG